MKTQVATCIKNYNSNSLNLIKDKEYDVSMDKDSLLLFDKRGWFKLTEWQEYLEIKK